MTEKRLKPITAVVNVIFIIFFIIELTFEIVKHSVNVTSVLYGLGLSIGVSLLPIIFVVIYNSIKGEAKTFKIISICVTTFFIILVVPYHSGVYETKKVDSSWHRYNARQFEIVGKDKPFVEVLSDGWKIIEKTDGSRDDYEWGWELTIRTLNNPNSMPYKSDDGNILKPVIHIEKIEYILMDKDGFELTRYDMSPNAFVGDNNTKGWFVEHGVTETYRQTAIIPKAKAFRAAQSAYRIIVE